jgi:hypothetical protein
MLSEIDPTGNSAGTAVATITAQMAELFSDFGAEERNKKAAELADKRERAEEDLLRTQIQLEQRQKKATELGTADTIEARSARLSVTNTEAETRRLAQSISDMDKELSQFASIDAMRKSDPGTTTGRLLAVSENNEARNFFLRNLKGEEIYKPLFTGLVTLGSKQQESLKTSLRTVTSEVKAFADAMTTQTITPQQKIAMDLNRNEALQNAESLADPQIELSAAIKKIREDAERNTTLPLSFSKIMANAIEAPFRSFVPLGTPQEEAQYTIDRLNDLIKQSQPLMGNLSPNDQRQVDMLRQQMEIVANLSRLSIDSPAKTILGPVATPPSPVQPIESPNVVKPPEPRNEPTQNRFDQSGSLNPNMTREEISQQLIDARRELAKPAPPNTDMEVLKQQQLKLIASLEALAAKIDSNTVSVERNNEILQQDVQTNNTGTIQAQVEKRK